MSAFRLTRLGSIAPVTLVLALFPALAQAQAPIDPRAPAAADSEPAAPAPAAPAPAAPAAEATPAPAPSSAVAAPATEPAAKTLSAEDTKADAAAEAAAAAAANEAIASGGRADEVDQVKLNLYGFTDFTYSTQLGNFELASPYSSFAVGKLNLYAAADLGSGWRSLAEIRFMYLPNGQPPASAHRHDRR
jgi:hypothetical protein